MKQQSTALATTLEQREAEKPDEAGMGAGSVLAMIRDPKVTKQLQLALPNQLDASRFVRLLLTECRQNPALFACSPESFMAAMFDMAAVGLEPGPLGHAYLVPFKREITLILGYKGLIELAYRTEMIDFIAAVTVHEGEPFRVLRGDRMTIEHEELGQFADAPAVAYYAIAFPKGGGHPVSDVMWPGDIERIRKRAPSAGASSSPWKSDFEAMAQKTVLRRLLNRGKVRLTPEVAEALIKDEARELGYAPKLDTGADDAIAREAAKRAAAEEQAEKAAAEQARTSTESATAAATTTSSEPAADAKAKPSSTSTASERTAGSDGPGTDLAMCAICGAVEDPSGHLKHDDAKHEEAAKAKRDSKATQTVEELQASKQKPADDPGAAFRERDPKS